MQQKGIKTTSKEAQLCAVFVVYKAKSGAWRGFVQPYDITTEAPTKAKALLALKEMAEVYEEGLKKYSYPAHLLTKHLSFPEDVDKFNKLALDSIALKGKVEGADYYAEAKTISS